MKKIFIGCAVVLSILLYGCSDSGVSVDQMKQNETYPVDYPHPTNGQIVWEIFGCKIVGGNVGEKDAGLLLKAENAHFKDWDIGSGNYEDREKYILNVEFNENITTVHLTAQSDFFRISESIRLEWAFDSQICEWTVVRQESVDYNFEMLTDLCGTYLDLARYSKYTMIIDSVDKNGHIKGSIGDGGDSNSFTGDITGLYKVRSEVNKGSSFYSYANELDKGLYVMLSGKTESYKHSSFSDGSPIFQKVQ